MRRKEFFCGMRDSLPVCVGYFSVSFGFGVAAVAAGIHFLPATIMSLTNVTSAGQFAAIAIIAAVAPIINLIITQLVINSRYALMSLALGQRLGTDFGILSRMIIAFYNTDEIFAIAMQRDKKLTHSYMYGLGPLPILGWSIGTLLGAVAGTILPSAVAVALGVALYGMFVAIVVPAALKDKTLLCAVCISAALSCVFYYVPVFKSLPAGIPVVLATLISAGICAVLFPEDSDL